MTFEGCLDENFLRMESLNLNLKATNEGDLEFTFLCFVTLSLGIQICIKLQKLFLRRLPHITPHELKTTAWKSFRKFFLSVTLPRRKMKNDVVNVARLKCKGSKFSLQKLSKSFEWKIHRAVQRVCV